MCGIAGFHIRESQSLDSIKENINNMLISLKHRGPDSTGYALYANNERGRHHMTKLPTHLHRQGYSDKRNDGKVYRKFPPLTQKKTAD